LIDIANLPIYNSQYIYKHGWTKYSEDVVDVNVKGTKNLIKGIGEFASDAWKYHSTTNWKQQVKDIGKNLLRAESWESAFTLSAEIYLAGKFSAKVGSSRSAKYMRGADEGANVVSRAPKSTVKFHKHHTIPKEVQKLLPERVRTHPDVIGRKGLPNKMPVEANRHLGELHKGPDGGVYNEVFKTRLLELRGSYDRVRVKDVLKVRDELLNKFDIK